MIGQRGSGRGVNLVEVARDAELLDQLAARAEILDGGAVAAMLASFAAEVDEGLAALLDASPADKPADRGLAAVPDAVAAPRRGHGLRATTIAVVLGATLSVSGVAAAVTGDPFSPYKGMVSAVRGGNDLPPNAARIAAMNHKLAGTRAQIAHGDLAGAQATLAALRADLATMTDLTTGERSAIEARIAALEAALGRATSQADAHEKQQKSGIRGTHTAAPNTQTQQPNNTKTPEPNSTKNPEPKPTNTPEPANTGPQGSGGTHTAEPQNTKSAGPTDPSFGGGGGSGAGGGEGSDSDQSATDSASKGDGGGAQAKTQSDGATH